MRCGLRGYVKPGFAGNAQRIAHSSPSINASSGTQLAKSLFRSWRTNGFLAGGIRRKTATAWAPGQSP